MVVVGSRWRRQRTGSALEVETRSPTMAAAAFMLGLGVPAHLRDLARQLVFSMPPFGAIDEGVDAFKWRGRGISIDLVQRLGEPVEGRFTADAPPGPEPLVAPDMIDLLVEQLGCSPQKAAAVLEQLLPAHERLLREEIADDVANVGYSASSPTSFGEAARTARAMAEVIAECAQKVRTPPAPEDRAYARSELALLRHTTAPVTSALKLDPFTAPGPAGGTRYICPLHCGWHHDVAPVVMPDLAACSAKPVMNVLAEQNQRIEDEIAAHLRTHTLVEWVKTVQELRREVHGLRAVVRGRHERVDETRLRVRIQILLAQTFQGPGESPSVPQVAVGNEIFHVVEEHIGALRAQLAEDVLAAPDGCGGTGCDCSQAQRDRDAAIVRGTASEGGQR